MKKIISILTLAIVAVGTIPFFGVATKIEWTAYLGIPLIILTGSAGVAFVSNRFEAIIGGVIIAAMWPAMLEMLRSALLLL